MQTKRVVLAVLMLLATLVPLAGVLAAGSPPCPMDEPRRIFACLKTAYESRDLEAYVGLLAEDFVFMMGDKNHGWSREQDVQMTGKLFASPETRAIHLSVEGLGRPTRGPQPDTWVYSDFTMRLEVESIHDGKATLNKVDEKILSFVIRRVQEPNPHFVIVEWRTAPAVRPGS